jgi:hypothetical protein
VVWYSEYVAGETILTAPPSHGARRLSGATGQGRLKVPVAEIPWAVRLPLACPTPVVSTPTTTE